MKICISICGLPRCLDLVVKNLCCLFENDEIDFIFCISDMFLQDQDKYFESIYLSIDSNKHKIIKRCFFLDKYDSSYRNCLNYTYKLVEGIKLFEPKYDLYIAMRSDLIINHLNISDMKDNKIYFFNNNINQFTIDEKNKINDSIIIFKNYKYSKLFYKLFDFALENTNYANIILFNYLKENIDCNSLNTNLNISLNNSLNIDFLECDYKLVLFQCNMIAIAGDSGSGKSTLLKCLEPLFDKEKSLTLETDRYHKWERGDENYKNFTHLNPYSNHLEKMYEDVYNLKIGNEIFQVDYDHRDGKFTQREKIESKNNIILCGLHTFYEKNINPLLDLKIFMDTDRKLIKKWKIERDVYERGYSLEKVLNQIEIREEDYNKYIIKQKYLADIIINFYEEDETNNLKCKIKIKNEKIISKTIKKIIEYNYIFEMKDGLCIELKNKFLFSYDTNIKNYIENQKFKSEYFKEIFYLILLSISL